MGWSLGHCWREPVKIGQPSPTLILFKPQGSQNQDELQPILNLVSCTLTAHQAWAKGIFLDSGLSGECCKQAKEGPSRAKDNQELLICLQETVLPIPASLGSVQPAAECLRGKSSRPVQGPLSQPTSSWKIRLCGCCSWLLRGFLEAGPGCTGPD